jgi:hypothetical protein
MNSTWCHSAVTRFAKSGIAKTYSIKDVKWTCPYFPHLLSHVGKIRYNTPAPNVRRTERPPLFWGINAFPSVFSHTFYLCGWKSAWRDTHISIEHLWIPRNQSQGTPHFLCMYVPSNRVTLWKEDCFGKVYLLSEEYNVCIYVRSVVCPTFFFNSKTQWLEWVHVRLIT